MSHWLDPELVKAVVSFERQVENRSVPIGAGLILAYETSYQDKKIWMPCVITCKHVAQIPDIHICYNMVGGNFFRYDFRNAPYQPVYHRNADLAIIPTPLVPNLDFKSVLPNMFEQFADIPLGDDIFLLGFPLGIRAPRMITPVVRSGIISLKNEDDKTFLIEVSAFPGSSGGPVFLRPSVIDHKEKSIGKYRSVRLVGIVTGYITYQDVAVSQQTQRTRVIFEEDSGLSVVYSTEYILEILQSTEFTDLAQRILREHPPVSVI